MVFDQADILGYYFCSELDFVSGTNRCIDVTICTINSRDRAKKTSLVTCLYYLDRKHQLKNTI